jgi:predicted adenine nucleotide alpha hydrolase (AANH) superfamily ATPase
VECVRALQEEGLSLRLFWYNPNIHPWTEYKARRDSLLAFAGEQGIEVLRRDEYGLRPFLTALGPPPPPAPPERCALCYRLRLNLTASLAAKEGFAAFSTTLLISPYQNHELIKELAREAAREHGTSFLYRDFRPRYAAGQRAARERGYYRQKYCGCLFSEEERYLKSPAKN